MIHYLEDGDESNKKKGAHTSVRGEAFCLEPWVGAVSVGCRGPRNFNSHFGLIRPSPFVDVCEGLVLGRAPPHHADRAKTLPNAKKTHHAACAI